MGKWREEEAVGNVQSGGRGFRIESLVEEAEKIV